MNPTPNDPRKAKSPAVDATGLFKTESKTDKTEENQPNPAGQSEHAELMALENETCEAMRAAGLKSVYLGYPRVVYPLRQKYLTAETEIEIRRSNYRKTVYPSRLAKLEALRALRDQAIQLAELKRQCEEAGV